MLRLVGLACCSVGSLLASPPVVNTSFGPLQGTAQASGVSKYQGVPYAQPPNGTRRWQPPLDWATPWGPGVRNAVTAGASCIQGQLYAPGGPRSEDCLYLNVWVPPGGKHAPGSLPVVVFLHGGAFIFGRGADYNAESFSQNHGIVFVSINYRLGALGWMLVPDDSAEPGAYQANFGLLDQISALRWVRQEIAAFGGDPARVTVWGQSAGAISIAALLTMPRARGLFQGAMIESGGAVVHGVDYSLQQSETMCRKLQCPPIAVEPARAMDCLRSKSAAQILAAMGPEFEGFITHPLWCPIIDGVSLPHDPLLAMQRGESWAGEQGVPLLIGFNTDEATLFVVPYHLLGMDDAYYGETVREGMRNFRDLSDSAAIDSILQRWPPAGGVGLDNVLSSVEIVGQVAFSCQSDLIARLLTAEDTDRTSSRGARPSATTESVVNHWSRKRNNSSGGGGNNSNGRYRQYISPRSRAWVYHFAYKSLGLDYCDPLDLVLGVYHTAELPFTYNQSGGSLGWNATSCPKLGPKQQVIADAMHERWANFIRRGDPNGAGLEPTWPEFQEGVRQHLRFEAQPIVERGYEKDVCSYWERLLLGVLR